MITVPTPSVPADVAADCAPAPVPAPILRHASALGLPMHRVTAAPVLGRDVRLGDVIRHPALPALFMRVVLVDAPGMFACRAIMDTGMLAPAGVTMMLDPARPVAVWHVA